MAAAGPPAQQRTSKRAVCSSRGHASSHSCSWPPCSQTVCRRSQSIDKGPAQRWAASAAAAVYAAPAVKRPTQPQHHPPSACATRPGRHPSRLPASSSSCSHVFGSVHGSWRAMRRCRAVVPYCCLPVRNQLSRRLARHALQLLMWGRITERDHGRTPTPSHPCAPLVKRPAGS